MQFELTTLTIVDDDTIRARMISMPAVAAVEATLEVSIPFSMDESIAVISERAMTALHAALNR